MPAPTIIGGNGYRWRGRAIRTIRKNNATCVTMPRKDSMIMAPCSIHEGLQYKVTLIASKNSGNGALLINFFGGKHYDGDPISVNVTSHEMREYTVAVEAPKFPKSLPVYLRVWRPNDATGNLFIQSIMFEPIGGRINIPREPKLQAVTAHKKSERPKPKPVQSIKAKKERPRLPEIKEADTVMKFKPYKVRSTTMANKVLVRNPEDVPKVSIITPTRDGIELLKACYKAIDSNTSYPNWEWIIGDSNSTDGTALEVKSWQDPRIKLVERGTTEGSFSSINNELVEYASGDYLVFLNDDTEPQPFWLYEMMSKIYRHNNIGVVGARLMYGPEKIQHAGVAFIPQGPANLGKAVLSSFPKGFAYQDRFYQAVTAACMLVRKVDFLSVGGFDPIYYFCYEDIDLCLKIRDKLKKKVLYAANAEVYHKESVTQKKHRTAGEKQQIGIQAFKDRWMRKVEQDFVQFQKNMSKGLRRTDISFVTCVNNMTQYRNYVVGSLFKNKTGKTYEVIPVLNFDNPHSAAGALNIGIEKARGDIVVLCHQDVLFYENWVEMLFERITEVETRTKKWGVLGTAGISKRDDTIGVVHNMKGNLQWQSSKRAKVYPVQTVDEHCMVIRKSSGLKFDAKTFDGFHFYGPDICLTALSQGFMNFGILCPLVHDSASGSLVSGKREFMRLLNALAKKWRETFPHIRTPTSIVRRRSVRTFVRFKTK